MSTFGRITQRSSGGAFMVCAAAVLSLACSAGRPSSGVSLESIAREEIERYVAAGTTNLFELIQRARPRWLESRGERSLNLDTVILVYHNQQRLGGPDVLRDLRPDNVVRIRRLDAARAGLLPGARDQHVEAAIVIDTAR